MASYRPYRPAIGLKEALEEIETKSGILYDPEVVRVCLDLSGRRVTSWKNSPLRGGYQGFIFEKIRNNQCRLPRVAFRISGSLFLASSSPILMNSLEERNSLQWVSLMSGQIHTSAFSVCILDM